MKGGPPFDFPNFCSYEKNSFFGKNFWNLQMLSYLPCRKYRRTYARLQILSVGLMQDFRY